jgi:hypothetical protein
MRQHGALKIASIGTEAKTAARAAGLDDNQTALLEVARAAPERQVEIVAEIVERRTAPMPSPAPQEPAGGVFAFLLGTPEEQAERAREREAKRAKVLARYGSEEAVLAPTERERALERAWRSSKGQSAGDACPLPTTVQAAWVEMAGWERLRSDRYAVDPRHGDDPWIEARTTALEETLNERPATSLEDFRARLAWFQHEERIERQFSSADRVHRFERLRADADEIERSGR